MPRSLLILLGAALLGALIWLATGSSSTTQSAVTPAVAASTDAPRPFALRMSTTLSSVPTRPPRAVTPPTPLKAWWQQTDNQRTSLFLIAACLLGLALAALWRRADATQPLQFEDRVAPEIADDPANDESFALRSSLETERSAWSEREQALTKRIEQLQQDVSDGAHAPTDTSGEREQLATQLTAAHTELDDATSRIAQLEDDLAHSRDASLDESTQLGEMREQIASRDDTIARQQSDIDASTQEQTKLGEQLEHAQRQVEELTANLNGVEAQNSDALHTTEDLRDQQQTLIERHESREQGLRARIDELEAQSNTLAYECEESAEALASATVQATAIAERLGTRENDLHALQTHTDTLQEELSLRMDELVTLRVKVDELTTDREVAQGVAFDLERAMLTADEREQAVRTELAREQKALGELDSDAQSLREELAGVDELRSTARKEHDALHEQLTRTKTQLEEQTQALEKEQLQVVQLHEDLVELDEAREKLSQWQSSVDTLRTDLRQKDHRIDELVLHGATQSEEIATLEETASTIDALQKKLTEQTLLARVLKDGADSMRMFKARADERQHSIDGLTHDLDNERAAVARLDESLSEQTSATRAAEQALEASAAQANELHEEIEAHVAHISQLDEQLATRIETLAARDTELAEHKSALRRARQTQTQLLEDAAIFEDITREMDELLSSPTVDAAPEVEFDADDERTHHTDIVTRLQDSLAQYSRTEQELDDTASQLSTAHNELVELRKTVADLQPRLDDSTSSLEQARAAAVALQQQVERQEEALLDAQKTQSRADELQSRLDSTAATEHDVMARIETLSCEQAALDTQYTALVEDHENLVNTHREQIATLASRDETLAALHEEHSAIVATRDELAARVDEHTEQLAQRDQDIKALKQRESEALSELTRLQDAEADLNAEIDSVREHDDDRTLQQQSLTREQADLQEKLATAEDARRQLFAQLEHEHARNVAQSAEQETLQNELTTLQQTLQDKTFEVEALTERRDLLESQMREVLQREEAQSHELQAERRQETSALSDQLTARDQTLANLVEAVAQVSDADVDPQNAAQRVHDLATGLRNKDGRIDELSHANIALRDALRDVRAEADTQAQRLRAQLERAERTSQDLTAELEKLHGERKPARARIEQLGEQLAKSQARSKLLEQALVKYQAQLDKLAPKPSKAPDVPVLKRSVGAPPVLTAAVVPDDEND